MTTTNPRTASLDTTVRGDGRNEQPEHASALIFSDKGQYLLHLRDDRPGIREPGAWSCLGGGKEPEDRSLEDTVRRELLEETGIQPCDLQRFTVVEAAEGDGRPLAVAIYTGRWNGDPRCITVTEGVGVAWFSPEQLPLEKMSRTTADLVRQHAASRGPALPGPH